MKEMLADRLRDECEALRKENAELRADAERYRWLRNQDEDKELAVFTWGDDCCVFGEDLDASIDGAINSERRK